MSAFQGKNRLVMIEQRRLPFRAVVARFAILGALAKLIRMRILMTFAASAWSALKYDVNQLQLHIRRFMTFCARHRSVSTKEWEFRLRMIKPSQVVPGLG